MSTIAELIRPPRIEDAVPELADAARAARSRSSVPLFVQIPAALGLLLASGFLCGGFTMLLKDDLVIGVVGVVLALASIGASWLPLPWFGRPLVLAAAILGRLLIAWGAGSDNVQAVMPVVEVVMLALHRDGLNRAWAAATVPAWLLMDNEHLTAVATTLALIGGGAVVVLRRWWLPWPAPLREIAAACATGWLGLALVLPCVEGPAWSLVFSGGMALVIAGIAGVLAFRAEIGLAASAAAVAVPMLVAAFTTPVPGVLVAMTVAVVGFVGRSPRLWVAAVAAMTGYGVYFNYDLAWGLVAKGGAMIGAGAVLALGGLLAGTFRDRPSAPREPRAPLKLRLEHALVGVGALVAVSAAVVAAGVQEVQLARSEMVYLPLAPVDPRSLVQGDYMRLGYEIEQDLRALQTDAGVAVLEVDERGVGSFGRLDDGAPLGSDERRIRFFESGRGPAVTSRAYLFQEGTAAEYERAEYGMVAITPEGRGALVGLADATLTRLGPPARRW
jgi:uncharacterized membrane-anchored protein